jgi:NADH:ubiquinone oxidoreductase subunit 3 (subunit A)
VIGSIVAYSILHAFFFSLIFWIITFALKFYYSNKNFEYKLNFYECGFKSLTNVKVQYNINFILIILFLLIYDGEFLILIPLALNISIVSLPSVFLFIFFIYFLIITILYDLIYNSLEWQV